MTHPSPHSPAPEVELDPAAEHVTRHVASATSTALAATQHAMQSSTLRAYLARDTASAEARAGQRALHAQQQLAHTGEVTGRAADRAGIAASPAVDAVELGVGLAAPDPVLGHGIDPGMDPGMECGITSGINVPGPTPGIEP